MTRKMYILVLPAGVEALIDPGSVGAVLDQFMEQGDTAYVIDGNVAILSTALRIDELAVRLKRVSAGVGQFFVTDISKSDRAGNMVPKFWSFIRQSEGAEVA